MNSTNHTEHDLNARLSRQAEQFDRLGGADLDLGQVLDRAGEIKRGRRMRATMVMAACVLAIAVPTAIVAVGRGGDKEPQPAPPSQVDRSALTLGDLKQGDAPKTGWMQGKVWHGPDGQEYEWSQARVTAVATIGDSILVATADPQGQRANLVPPVSDSAQPVTSWPMEGGFAVSGDGLLAAFVEPDGTPVVVSSPGTGDDKEWYRLPRIQRGSGFDAVQVNGQGCRATVEFSCMVWVTSHGSSPESWTSTAHDIAQKVRPGFSTVTDVDSTNTLLAGIVDVRDDLTTCSAVEPSTKDTPLWSTCDYRLLEFSPDDQRLIAAGSVGDGIGETQLAVLDAQTGKVELDLKVADQVFVGQTAWEDGSHVLATVFEGGKWAILRIGLGGEREYAVAPVPAEDIDSPFVLASR